jgi:hypothetical protein
VKKNISFGYYDKEIDAARAYDREAIKRKLFNKLNFYNSPELLADASVEALAAIANATVVGSAGASTSTPTSKCVGVSYDRPTNTWKSRIQVHPLANVWEYHTIGRPTPGNQEYK